MNRGKHILFGYFLVFVFTLFFFNFAVYADNNLENFGPDGKLITKTVTTHNPDGTPLIDTTFDADGNLIFVAQYDYQNQIITTTFYDDAGNKYPGDKIPLRIFNGTINVTINNGSTIVDVFRDGETIDLNKITMIHDGNSINFETRYLEDDLDNHGDSAYDKRIIIYSNTVFTNDFLNDPLRTELDNNYEEIIIVYSDGTRLIEKIKNNYDTSKTDHNFSRERLVDGEWIEISWSFSINPYGDQTTFVTLDDGTQIWVTYNKDGFIRSKTVTTFHEDGTTKTHVHISYDFRTGKIKYVNEEIQNKDGSFELNKEYESEEKMNEIERKHFEDVDLPPLYPTGDDSGSMVSENNSDFKAAPENDFSITNYLDNAIFISGPEEIKIPDPAEYSIRVIAQPETLEQNVVVEVIAGGHIELIEMNEFESKDIKLPAISVPFVPDDAGEVSAKLVVQPKEGSSDLEVHVYFEDETKYEDSNPSNNDARITTIIQNISNLDCTGDGCTQSDSEVNTTLKSQTKHFEIPPWVKTNALWWSQDQIDDKTFALAIGHLVKTEVIQLGSTFNHTSGNLVVSDNISIPSWIKNNAGWWGNGQITDNDFKQGIQFMLNEEVISFNPSKIPPAKFPPPSIPKMSTPPNVWEPTLDSTEWYVLAHELSPDSEVFSTVYEIKKWNEYAMKKLLKIKHFESSYLKELSNQAWNEYGKMDKDAKLEAIEDIQKLEKFKQTTENEATYAVQVLKKSQEDAEEVLLNAKDRAIPDLEEIEVHARVLQTRIDEMPEIGSVLELKEAYKDAENAQKEMKKGLVKLEQIDLETANLDESDMVLLYSGTQEGFIHNFVISDDGPVSKGGNEPEGSFAGDNIWGNILKDIESKTTGDILDSLVCELDEDHSWPSGSGKFFIPPQEKCQSKKQKVGSIFVNTRPIDNRLAISYGPIHNFEEESPLYYDGIDFSPNEVKVYFKSDVKFDYDSDANQTPTQKKSILEFVNFYQGEPIAGPFGVDLERKLQIEFFEKNGNFALIDIFLDYFAIPGHQIITDSAGFDEFDSEINRIADLIESDISNDLLDSELESEEIVTESEPLCGNGILEPAEQCDDENLINGDGCSSACLIEESDTESSGTGSQSQPESQDNDSGSGSEKPQSQSNTYEGNLKVSSVDGPVSGGFVGIGDDVSIEFKIKNELIQSTCTSDFCIYNYDSNLEMTVQINGQVSVTSSCALGVVNNNPIDNQILDTFTISCPTLGTSLPNIAQMTHSSSLFELKGDSSIISDASKFPTTEQIASLGSSIMEITYQDPETFEIHFIKGNGNGVSPK